MAASDNISKQQFAFQYQLHEGIHNIEAFTPDKVHNLGWMQWRDDTGEVEHIMVNNDRRRQGIATAMWNRAHQLSQERNVPAPQHSSRRTPSGDAWAKAVGGPVPRRKSVHYGFGRVGHPTDPDKYEFL